jgi:hypothetical protein
MRPERGTNPWSENPVRGCAMKQAREARGGANRRERAKRCGRTVDGLGTPVVEWTPCAGVVKREGTPRKAPAAATRAGRRSRDGTLETNEAHERMNPASRDEGGRPRRKTTSVRRKRRGNGGIGSTRRVRYDATYNTLQRSERHERLPCPRRRERGSTRVAWNLRRGTIGTQLAWGQPRAILLFGVSSDDEDLLRAVAVAPPRCLR